MSYEQRIACCRRLLDGLGLEAWELHFTLSRRNWGMCVYSTPERPGRIEISWFLHRQLPWEEMHKTVLHEAAHALCPVPLQGEDLHGAVWQAKLRELGGSPEDGAFPQGRLPGIRWRAECGACGACHGRWQAPRGQYYRCSCGAIVTYDRAR